MKTDWDYTSLADAYLERPPYSDEALRRLFERAGLAKGDLVCDIGAGVGHLSIPLAKAGFRVVAVEPNDAMRANGRRQTAALPEISWVEAGGENTGQPAGQFDFVTFGSSFNVMDRNAALKETHRLLKPGRYFTCLWNHRDLADPIQKRIEEIIAGQIPGYDYGVRRQDQSEIIALSRYFDNVEEISGSLLFNQKLDKVIEAWRSHATVERQAGERFPAVLESISRYLESLGRNSIDIPYITRAWIARRKA